VRTEMWRLASRALVIALFMTMALPWTAFADTFAIDNDIASAGNQNAVNLTSAPGASVNTSAQLVITRSGSNHLAAGTAVTFAGVAAQTTLPSGYTLATATLIVPSPWNTNDQYVAGTAAISFVAPATAGTYSYTAKWQSTVSFGNALTGAPAFTVNLTVTAPADTTPPVLSLPANITAEATGPSGAAVTYTATATDLVDGPVTPSCAPASGSTFALGATTVTCSAVDDAGNTASGSFTITVQDTTPPTMLTITAGTGAGAVGTAVPLSATATDVVDTSLTYTFTVDGATLSGSSYAGTTADVVNVCATATDDAGNTSTPLCTWLAIYDPAAGFVTGGGWIASPVGACAFSVACGGSAVGNANFGFVSKYQRGATTPTGNTEFNFNAGDFRFSSTSYSWLVVSGSQAQYKGTGTVNGGGSYGFILTAYDGGAGPDGFRIKITDGSGNIVYDNKRGSSDDMSQGNTQPLGAGSIIVHK
jgi:hypothetical protein